MLSATNNKETSLNWETADLEMIEENGSALAAFANPIMDQSQVTCRIRIKKLKLIR